MSVTLTNLAKEGYTAETDSTTTTILTKKELHRQRVAKRNFHYNILGGPSYTPDFGFLIGGSALMTFRMNPQDTTMTFGNPHGVGIHVRRRRTESYGKATIIL
jgi:hypothetical protein